MHLHIMTHSSSKDNVRWEGTGGGGIGFAYALDRERGTLKLLKMSGVLS